MCGWRRITCSWTGGGLFAGIFAETLVGSSGDASTVRGDAGTVRVKAGDLKVRNGAQISTSTEALGRGGDVRVEADNVLLSGDRSGITAETSGSGDAGSITLEATDIELNGGAGIFAGSSGTGLAGQIFIKALDNLRLVNGSQISVATTQADARDITLEVGDLLHLSNGSRITTSVAGGTGKGGGDITLNSVFVVLDEGSSIIANALKRKFHPPNQEFAFRIKAYGILARRMWTLIYVVIILTER
jgi:large exoprotein involved in heme utilization and adhesion